MPHSTEPEPTGNSIQQGQATNSVEATSQSAPTAASSAEADLAAQVAELAAQADGSPRGPDIPIEMSNNLVYACLQDGRTFVDGQGECASGENEVELLVVSNPRGGLARCSADTPEFHPTRQLDSAPGPAADLVIESVGKATDEGSLLYEGRLKTGNLWCAVELEFRGRSGAFPRFSAGQALRLFRETRVLSDHAAASVVEIRSVDDELLWWRYLGTLPLHDRLRPSGFDVGIEPDPQPTCVLTSTAQTTVSGVTIRTANDSCHLEAFSAACCTLWGKEYRVGISSVLHAWDNKYFGGTDSFSYVIVRSDLLAQPPN